MTKRFYYIKKIILTTLLIVVSNAVFACKCAPIMPITKAACNEYNVIFSGHVDSVSSCNDKGLSIAYFAIDTVYKGNVTQQVQVEFDCSSSCLMSFATGENWLMYTNYEKFDLLTVSICGHSRKFFAEGSQDIYSVSAEQTFEQEQQFLKSTLGTQPFKEVFQQLTGRNEQPSGAGKLILLAISFLAMAIVYFIIKRKNVK